MSKPTSMGTPAQDILGPLFHRAIVADPTDPNVVFLAGEGISGAEQKKSAIRERLESAVERDGALVFFIVSLAALF